MNGPIDESYLQWLYAQSGFTDSLNPSRTNWSLALQLHKKEFVWLVPNDDNRAADGRALRLLFLQENKIREPDPGWLNAGCSMLEMLIGLSLRLHFITSEAPSDWFWKLLENIGIDISASNDRRWSAGLEAEIDNILNRVIWRTYSTNGEGGLFPLPNTDRDQRHVEIWYQMSEYLVDDF